MTDVPLLVEPARHLLRPGTTVEELGDTVVIAPHPDDETLGCGGLIALLAQAGHRVDVLVVTDGLKSHPASRAYPPERLVGVREGETRRAMAALGLGPTSVHFWRQPDCGLPEPGTNAFDVATADLIARLQQLNPTTIVAPWRRDPHCDHVSTWWLARSARAELAPEPRWLEYPIWAWMAPACVAAPQAGDGIAWRLDVTSALERKLDAIHQYQSQIGHLTDDESDTCVLPPPVLACFRRDWELFVDPTDG